MVGEVGWPMHANPLRPVMSDLSSVARRVHAPELGMERARTGPCTGGYEASQQQWVNKQRMRSAAGRTATVPAATTVRDLIERQEKTRKHRTTNSSESRGRAAANCTDG